MLTAELMTISPNSWVLLMSNLVILAVVVVAIVNERYEDTLLQCIGLCGIALGVVIASLQIVSNGYSSERSMTMIHLSVAWYGVATVLKHMKRTKKRRPTAHSSGVLQ